MKIINILAAASALLVPAIASAADPAQQTFTRDGATYVYTRKMLANGTQIIEGRRDRNGAPFRLIVRQGRVTGTVAGTPVAFRAPAAGSSDVLAAN